MSIKKKIGLLMFVLFTTSAAKAQDVAIKTNFLYDIWLNVDLGLEVGLAPRWTVDVTADYNNWTIEGRDWKHWMVQPEARYWFCNRFMGHFLGIHVLGGEYDFGHIRSKINALGSDFRKLGNNYYEGWGVGAGIAYGYAFVLGRHWNLEAELGIGYIYAKYDAYDNRAHKNPFETNQTHHYFGATKAAVNLVYLF